MKQKLANIASIQSGYHFTEKFVNDKHGNISFIQLKDIDEYNNINYPDLWKFKLNYIRPYQFLQKGDIILKSRGNVFTASVINNEVDSTVATSHFFIIRIEEKNIMPEYIKWFLNNSITQKIIKLGSGGTHMQVLNKKFLENILITIPSLNIQKKVVALSNLSEQEQKLLKRKIELKAMLIDLSLQELINKS